MPSKDGPMTIWLSFSLSLIAYDICRIIWKYGLGGGIFNCIWDILYNLTYRMADKIAHIIYIRLRQKTYLLAGRRRHSLSYGEAF